MLRRVAPLFLFALLVTAMGTNTASARLITGPRPTTILPRPYELAQLPVPQAGQLRRFPVQVVQYRLRISPTIRTLRMMRN